MSKRRYVAPPDAESWERQSGETTEAFAAFRVYRDMGAERSLAKVGRELGKATALMERWSSQWSWVARASDHDNDVDRRAREAQLQELEKMRARHLTFAQAMQRVAQHPINRLVEMVQEGKDPGLAPLEAAKLMEQGIKLERLFRGEPDQITKHKVSLRDRREAARKLLSDPDAGGAIDALARKLISRADGE